MQMVLGVILLIGHLQSDLIYEAVLPDLVLSGHQTFHASKEQECFYQIRTTSCYFFSLID